MGVPRPLEGVRCPLDVPHPLKVTPRPLEGVPFLPLFGLLSAIMSSLNKIIRTRPF